MLKYILKYKVINVLLLVLIAVITFFCLSSELFDNILYGYFYSIIDEYYIFILKIKEYIEELSLKHNEYVLQDYLYLFFSNNISLLILYIITFIIHDSIIFIVFFILTIIFFILLLSLYSNKKNLNFYLISIKLSIFCIILLVMPNIVLKISYPRDISVIFDHIHSNLSDIGDIKKASGSRFFIDNNHFNSLIFVKHEFYISFFDSNLTPVVRENNDNLEYSIYKNVASNLTLVSMSILSSLIMTPLIFILLCFVIYRSSVFLLSLLTNICIVENSDSFMQDQAKYLKDQFDSVNNSQGGIKLLNKVRDNK